MTCLSPEELFDKRREEEEEATESEVFDFECETSSIEREARRRSRTPVSCSAVIKLDPWKRVYNLKEINCQSITLLLFAFLVFTRFDMFVVIEFFIQFIVSFRVIIVFQD